MDIQVSEARTSRNGWLAAIVILAVACAVAAALSGFGHRWGWWDYRTGFSILRWAVYIAAGAGAVCLIAFVAGAVRKNTGLLLLGLTGAAIGAGVALPAWNMQRAGAVVPRIHDITTDTDNPPAFVAIAPLRRDAPNPAAYDGPKAAAEQKKAYADIQPVELALPPGLAYERALGAARDMGWRIIAASPDQGRIEATDATFWFGFEDDIVIRVAADGNRSRVDVRSKSRIGRSDFGTNAKRVRAYLRKLAAAAG